MINHEDIIDVDYCCHSCFVHEIVTEMIETDEDFACTNIIINGDMAQEIIRDLLNIEINDECFDINFFDFNSVDYDKEYIISIDSDLGVSCTPAYQDNEYRTGYLYTEADHTYIHEDCNWAVLDSVDSDDITIFGFEDED